MLSLIQFGEPGTLTSSFGFWCDPTQSLDLDYKIFIAGATLFGGYFYHRHRKLEKIRVNLHWERLFCLRLATGWNGEIIRGNKVFLEQVRWGRTRAVKAFLDAGMSPNESERYGRTALGYAASSQYLSPVLVILIKAGANVNQADYYGTTPLMYAAGEGNFLAVRYLLRAGASAQQTDKRGNNALMFCSGSEREGCEIAAQELTKVMCIPFVAEQFLADINHDLVSRLGGRAHNYDTTRQVAKIVRSYL